MVCAHIDACGFFLKFHGRKSTVWQGMIKQYCQGGEDCVRRVMLNAGQSPPSADLMPVGVHASRAFLALP